jgi:CCR4-NOT transcriptional regulation complex NOT5 subunit
MEIIMTQMRKFEQEAIATEIYEKIKATNSVVQKELEQTKKYKDIQAVVDELSELQNQVEELNKAMKNNRDIIGKLVKEFNDNISQNNFELTTIGSYYNNSGQLNWTDNHWDIMRNIERKLAIALISPDWKDKLSTIIDDIASQFGA